MARTIAPHMKRLALLLFLIITAAVCVQSSAAEKSATFFVRIHPAHARFLTTMTNAEGQAMEAHFAYWKARMAEHKLILAGPVPIDPGTFGILIVRASTLAEAEELVQHDPSVIAHVTDYEIYPLNLALYEGQP